LEALKNLTAQCSVKNLLLEKILFPSFAEYEEAGDIIKKKGIKTWVNCTMRMNDFYRSVKEKIKGNFSLSISGNSWGLACNGIHYLDYFAFIGGGSEFKLTESISNQMESKRKGYIEFEGSIKGFDDKGNYFEMTSIENPSLQIIFTFHGDGVVYIIEDVHGNAFLKSAETGGEWKQEKFRIAFQSEMSGLLAESILESGTCTLTTYEEALKIHKAFLQPFINYMQKSSKEKITVCPIT